METKQKQHTKELKSLKLKMDDVKFANSKMTKELAKSEKANSNLEFEIKQLKKKLENHQKTKEKSPKEHVKTYQILLFLTSLDILTNLSSFISPKVAGRSEAKNANQIFASKNRN